MKLSEISDWIGTNTTQAVAERIAQLNEALSEYAVHRKGCEVWNQTVRYFHDGEHEICSCGLDALLTGEKDD